jgi:hypothetical protein
MRLSGAFSKTARFLFLTFARIYYPLTKKGKDYAIFTKPRRARAGLTKANDLIIPGLNPRSLRGAVTMSPKLRSEITKQKDNARKKEHFLEEKKHATE